MQNKTQKGDTLTLTAPYDVASGGGALVGNIFGVAVTAVPNGTDGSFEIEGCFDLPSPTGDTINQGQALYWDNTAKNVTEITTGNFLIGVATAAKGSGVLVVNVSLNGTATFAAS